MNLMELVHPASDHGGSRTTTRRRSTPRFSSELAGSVRAAILRARQYLIAEQSIDGWWIGRESASPSLTSLLIFWLAYASDDHSELVQQCAAKLLELQSLDGGWRQARGRANDVSASVQCYFALKLVGIDPSSERLARARKHIRQLGGADAADESTRFLLALFGQISYEICPEGPAHTSWAAIREQRPVCNVEIERGIRELFVRPPRNWHRLPNFAAHERGFRQIDQLPFEDLFWHMIAERASGALADDEPLQVCERRMRTLVCVDEEENTAWPRRGSSPALDTAVVAQSLVASGMPPDNLLIASAKDRLSNVVDSDHQPQMDAAELAVLVRMMRRQDSMSGTDKALPPAIAVCDEWLGEAIGKCTDSSGGGGNGDCVAEIVSAMLDQQRSDGGWSDAYVSPSNPGASDVAVTGLVMKALRAIDNGEARLAIEKAVDFLRMTQCADGGWRRDADGADIQATAAAVCGLLAAGIELDDEAVAAGVNWLIVHQESDGGWSDAADEDVDGLPSSASPTAWAIMALVASGRANHRATRRGVEFLIDTQGDDGGWNEFDVPPFDAATNRRPRNHLHSVAWPLLALSKWAVAASSHTAAVPEVSLRLVSVSAAD